MVAYEVPLPVAFSRQEYWSGLSFPSPGDLPDPGMEPESSALAGGFFTTEPPGKPMTNMDNVLKNKDITLPAKVHIIIAMVFPIVMYRCEY